MRFAFKSRAQSRQLDVDLDLVSDGGGIQYLPRLIGRGRAVEHILTGKDILAEEAERYGWVNKAFDNSDTMDAYIGETLSLLVLCPTSALVLIRQSVNVASRPQLSDVVGDANRLLQVASQSDPQTMIGKIVELTNDQSSRDVELCLGESIPLLYEWFPSEPVAR
jgi:enoyl-CoA hydratase/carnithine racemase